STCRRRRRCGTRSASGFGAARERLVLAVRGGDEELAVRALEAAIPLGRALDQRRGEGLVAVRTLDLVSRGLCLAHTASVATGFARRSKRSRFMTLSQAATKSCTNVSCASSAAYTSASARSCECEPKTRSTAVAVHLSSPVARSRPS